MDLHGPVDHLVQHARGVELDQRDLDARLARRRRSCVRRRGSSGGRPGSRRPSRRSSSARSASRRAGRRTPRARASSEHISSNARCIWPSQRITWWMRPGPSRFCAIRKPSPRSPSRFAAGTRTPEYQTSQCVDQPRPRWPETGTASILDPRRVGRDEDLRHPPVRLGVRVGDRHHDRRTRRPRRRTRTTCARRSPTRRRRARRASGARSGPRPTPPARSSRRTSASRPRRAGAGTAPSARPSRTGAGSRRSRRRAPGS